MGAWVNENSIFMCDIKTMDFSPLVVYFEFSKKQHNFVTKKRCYGAFDSDTENGQ